MAAQLRALRDHAQKNGYMVAREYVDEAKSGRIADRPEFRKMIDETAKPNAPFQEILTPRLSDAPEMELSALNDLRALVDQRDDR